MAKIEGTQNIPAEWLNLYRGNATEAMPDNTIRKRYPYRIPHMQEGGAGVTGDQQIQRDRWKEAIAKFKTLSLEERARWYAAEPPWSSFLWYYNYAIMSALAGNANLKEGGAGVIKSIQTVTMDIPAGTGEGSATITTIDITKAVVMLFGNSLAIDEESGVFFVSMVYPYLSGLTSTQVKCKWSLPAPYYSNTKAATISVTVIEYI